MNSTMAGSPHMIAVSYNIFPLSQSNGYVYHPVMQGFYPDQNEDENSFSFLMVWSLDSDGFYMLNIAREQWNVNPFSCSEGIC